VDKPLGYRYGPDAIVWFASLGYDVPELFRTAVDYTDVFKGEMTTETPYQVSPGASQLSAPTGVVERKQVLHIMGEARVLGDIWAGGHLYVVRRSNAGNEAGRTEGDVELAVFLKTSL
jgi:hypothetical protein